MYKIGFDIPFRTGSSGGGAPCVITDPDAQAFWDELIVENGGAVDWVGIYGITDCQAKTGIDTFYITTKADGTYGQLGHLAIPIGGTAATHAVDMIMANANMTFINASHGAAGVTLTGVGSYILANAQAGGVSPLAGLNDNHIMNFSKNATHIGIGSSKNANTENLYGFVGTPLPAGTETFYSTSGVAGENVQGLIVDENQLLIYSRININRVDLYEDGISVGNSVVANTGAVLPDIAHIYGAVNVGGAPVFNSDGDFIGGSLGLSLTAAQALTLTNATKALNAVLGR